MSASRLLPRAMVSLVLWLAWGAGWAVCAQAQDAPASSGDGSWTATSEISAKDATPARTMESHSKSGNRSMDKQRVEVLGPNGVYQPDSETETETIQVNGTTTRTVVRTYTWDGNGRKKLAQVTEEEARSAAGGDSRAVRTISSSDVNGNLHIVQREVADTKKTSPDAQEKKTTVYVADGNGGFTTARQTKELQTRGGDKVEEKKITLLPDGNGNFKVSEVKEKTIKEEGQTRTSEERISRPDLDGRLSEASRTVSKETETGGGEKSETTDTYSKDVPGLTGDGRLHLNQRVVTVQKKDANGETTEQKVMQDSPGNPSDGQQVREKTKYVVKYGGSGTRETKTVQGRDINGKMNVAAVETRKSDQPPAAPAPPPPPPEKPQ